MTTINDLESFVDEYVDCYELDDDECHHEPTELERFLIEDAINGLIADEQFTALVAGSVAAERDELRALTSMLRAELQSTKNELRAEVERLRAACSRENDIISQTLGRVLGYPRFADDQKNFPGATDADGVCVGDHVAASLADEAADTIRALRAEVEALKVGDALHKVCIQQRDLAWREVEELRAEVERLRRMSEDASRYRWLRDWLRKVGLLEYIKAAHRPDGTHGPATVLRRPDVINGSELVGWSAGVGQGFDDAAIDAARAAQEGKT